MHNDIILRLSTVATLISGFNFLYSVLHTNCTLIVARLSLTTSCVNAQLFALVREPLLASNSMCVETDLYTIPVSVCGHV